MKNGKKFNNLDDVVFVSSQIPGPGSHNPQVIYSSKIEINSQTQSEHDGSEIMEEKE